jgi:hypothetical protein
MFVNDENSNGNSSGKDLLMLLALTIGVIAIAAIAMKAMEAFF